MTVLMDFWTSFWTLFTLIKWGSIYGMISMVCDIALIEGVNLSSFVCHSPQGTARPCCMVLLALPGLTSLPCHMAMLGPSAWLY